MHGVRDAPPTITTPSISSGARPALAMASVTRSRICSHRSDTSDSNVARVSETSNRRPCAWNAIATSCTDDKSQAAFSASYSIRMRLRWSWAGSRTTPFPAAWSMRCCRMQAWNSAPPRSERPAAARIVKVLPSTAMIDMSDVPLPRL